METLTFIQVRHQADNRLSKPTQKAAAAKMIAVAGLATVVEADMVSTAAGGKTRSVFLDLTDAAIS